MARRRRSDDDDISLFPFLSILACIIGVLTLLISALALAQMDSETVVRAEQYERVQDVLDQRQQEVDQLQTKIDSQQNQLASAMDAKQRQLAEARQRLEQLLQRIAELQAQLEQPGEKVEVPKLDTTLQPEALTEMQDQLKMLREQIAQLEKEVDSRNLPPEESQVSILPSGSGVGFDPIFVECDAGSIVIHASAPPERVRRNDLAGNDAFIQLLDQVAKSPKQTMVFLVRSDGLGTYQTARSLADAHETRHGKLPVIGKGRLDLSYFNKKN